MMVLKGFTTSTQNYGCCNAPSPHGHIMTVWLSIFTTDHRNGATVLTCLYFPTIVPYLVPWSYFLPAWFPVGLWAISCSAGSHSLGSPPQAATFGSSYLF